MAESVRIDTTAPPPTASKGRPVHCSICGLVFPSEAALREHLQTAHRGGQPSTGGPLPPGTPPVAAPVAPNDAGSGPAGIPPISPGTSGGWAYVRRHAYEEPPIATRILSAGPEVGEGGAGPVDPDGPLVDPEGAPDPDETTAGSPIPNRRPRSRGAAPRSGPRRP